jgi:hypothetical protein
MICLTFVLLPGIRDGSEILPIHLLVITFFGLQVRESSFAMVVIIFPKASVDLLLVRVSQDPETVPRLRRDALSSVDESILVLESEI